MQRKITKLGINFHAYFILNIVFILQFFSLF